MPFVGARSTHVTLADLLPLVENARRLPDGQYSGRCPAHDDHHNSLSLGQDASGKLLLYCHAGCSFDAVLAAFQARLPAVGSAPLALAAPASPRPRVSVPPPLPLPDRLPLHAAAVRLLWRWWCHKTGLPQDFWHSLEVDVTNGHIAFHFPGGLLKLRIRQGPGKYRWCPDGCPTPPLWPTPPQALPPHLVLTEGETDAATLRYAGFTHAYAVTKGAGTSLVPLVPSITGAGVRSLTLLYDLDEAGTEAAVKQAERLSALGLPTTAARLPPSLALAGGKDVNDLWHHLSHDVEAFRQAISPLLEPPAPATLDLLTPSWSAVEASAFLAMPADSRPWIVEGVLRTGWLAVLGGHGKQGKTTLALHMAQALCSGAPFISLTHPTPVIYCNFEMASDDVREMLRDQSATYGASPSSCSLSIVPMPPVPISADEFGAFLRTQPQPGLVIIDCFRAAYLLAADSEKDASTIGRVLRGLQHVARTTGWTILLIHHFRKATTGDALDLAGSAEWLAAPDLVMTWACPDPRQPGTLKLTGRIPPLPPQMVRLTRRGLDFLGTVSEATASATRDAILQVLRDQPDPLTADAIAVAVDSAAPDVGARPTRQELYTALRALHGQGALVRTGSGRRADPYLWRLALSATDTPPSPTLSQPYHCGSAPTTYTPQNRDDKVPPPEAGDCLPPDDALPPSRAALSAALTNEWQTLDAIWQRLPEPKPSLVNARRLLSIMATEAVIERLPPVGEPAAGRTYRYRLPQPT